MIPYGLIALGMRSDMTPFIFFQRIIFIYLSLIAFADMVGLQKVRGSGQSNHKCIRLLYVRAHVDHKKITFAVVLSDSNLHVTAHL